MPEIFPICIHEVIYDCSINMILLGISHIEYPNKRDSIYTRGTLTSISVPLLAKIPIPLS